MDAQCPTLLLRLLMVFSPFESDAPVASTLVLSGESCHDELRDATEVPTLRFHHHDGWLHAERILRARAARRGHLFRQLKMRDAQLAGQLTSHGKACEVARGAPVASLLVPMAMREQGLSSKLLAVEKQLEDHEVAALEWERPGRGVAGRGKTSSGSQTM